MGRSNLPIPGVLSLLIAQFDSRRGDGKIGRFHLPIPESPPFRVGEYVKEDVAVLEELQAYHIGIITNGAHDKHTDSQLSKIKFMKANRHWNTGPFRESADGSYEFNWTLADLLNPLVQAGLRLKKVLESPAQDP